jgi:hypothetical protein
MKLSLVLALVLVGAVQLAACGSDTGPSGDGPGGCYTTCEQAITIGTASPSTDVCAGPAVQAAEDWYACVCDVAAGSFVGNCPECAADCAGGALSDACRTCATPVGAGCLSVYSACVSP